MSDDQLETFQLEGLINSYIPHHHLVALSAPELLWHKLTDAPHDGNLLSLAFFFSPIVQCEGIRECIQLYVPSLYCDNEVNGLLWLELILRDFGDGETRSTTSCQPRG